MSDLTDFLLARIAEDEAVARVRPEHYAPFEREWEWCPKALTEPLGDLEWGLDAPCYCGVDKWRPSPRVLAECEAKRRIVEAHPLTRDVVPVWTGTTPGVACQNCAALGRNEGDIVEDIGPCETLLALAAVYADHPDYQESWQI